MPDFLPFDDLMRECNVTDPVEFMRILKGNSFQVRRGHDVPKDTADKIVKRLQGRGIDWYGYRQKERDRLEGGPLRLTASETLRTLAETFWAQLPTFSFTEVAGRRLLGIVCTGGFLRDIDGGAFVLALNSGINVLIGDRGSGKSTVLNLLGLLASPGDASSGVLVTKLMQLLREEPDGSLKNVRRVRSTLHHYGVSQYACFYSNDGVIMCYVVDVPSGHFALLERAHGHFGFLAPDDHSNVG